MKNGCLLYMSLVVSVELRIESELAVERNIEDKNLYLKAVLKAKPIDGDELIEQMRKVRGRLQRYLADTSVYLAEAIAAEFQ